MFSTFLAPRAPRPIADLPSPWPADAVSVRERIARAVAHRVDGDELELYPETQRDPDQVWFAAGLTDALFGAPDDTPKQTSARGLLAALGRLVRRPDAAAFQRFHDLLAASDVLGVIDGFLPMVTHQRLDPKQVAAVAHRIATGSPDIAAVKLAIGLLGVCSAEPGDVALFLDLGRYEELTLFCAVALAHMAPEPERAIWALAKSVDGWGRIQAVRRLAGTQDADIRGWLLRDGHRNAIMAEEIAYFCAVEGGLLEALRAPSIDDALLEGAGELIDALITGGPAEDMDDYADGGEAVDLYMEHLARRPAQRLRGFLTVHTIQAFEADKEADWAARAHRGWTAARRFSIRTRAAAYLARPEWPALVEAGLQQEARQDFWPASAVGKILGADIWPHHFRRQRDLAIDHWWELMQTDREDRVLQILDLAMERLDLALVGSGPGTSLGLGLAYSDDSALDFILQDLRRFPGLGWTLIEVGLRGRTIRARNMAHRALAAWDRAQWPPEAEALLRVALDKEPDAEVAQRIEALIAGRFPKHD